MGKFWESDCFGSPSVGRDRQHSARSGHWYITQHEGIMEEINYEGIGRFIYGSCRNGGDLAEVVNWMADDLNVPRPSPNDDLAVTELYSVFFAKYVRNDELQENYARFIETLKNRDS